MFYHFSLDFFYCQLIRVLSNFIITLTWNIKKVIVALIGGHDNLLILQNTFFFFVLDPSFLIYTCDEYLKESFAALVEAMDAFVLS